MTRMAFVFVALFALVSVVAAACSPADRQAVAPFVAPSEAGACALIKALAPSGTVDSVCATANDLAPYVADILARHASAPAKLSGPAPQPAIVLPMPTRVVERRRCTVWEHLPDPPDGGLP